MKSLFPAIFALSFIWPHVSRAENIYQHLYRLEYRGRVSWVLGTVHLSQIRLDNYAPIKQAIAQSSAVYLESSGVQAGFKTEADDFLPRHQNLEQMLTQPRQKKLKRFFANMLYAGDESQLTPGLFQRKPGVLLNLINRQINKTFASNLRQNGFEFNGDHPRGENAFDWQILRYAKALGKAHYGLRDSHEEIVFDRNYVQLGDLSELVDHYLDDDGSIKANVIASLASRFRNYADSGDIIAGFYLKGMNPDQYPQFYIKNETAWELANPNRFIVPPKLKDLDVRRFDFYFQADRQWIPVIADAVRSGNAFVAVGVAHVTGANARIIKGLKEQLGEELKVSVGCEALLLGN